MPKEEACESPFPTNFLCPAWLSCKPRPYESCLSCTALRSLAAGRLIPSENPITIADGRLTSLSPRTFGLLSGHLHAILCVDDEAIASAMRLIFERMKIVVEPSAAVSLAVILRNRALFTGRRVGVILSGGNVSLDRLPWNQGRERSTARR